MSEIESIEIEKEIKIIDFHAAILKRLEQEDNKEILQRICYQIDEQFSILKINAVFSGDSLDEKIKMVSSVKDLKYRLKDELEKNIIDFLNSRPRNDAVAGILLDIVVVNGDNTKYYTLDGLKLLSQYFSGFSETGDNKAIEIVTKLKDKEYLLAFVAQENNIIEN